MNSYLITGGNRGLGLSLVNALDGDSISRKDGFDITKDYEKIAKLSLQYDVFINNAFDGPAHESHGHFGQVKTLLAVYKAWDEAKKDGKIINIGSVAGKTVKAPIPMFETYRVPKAALEFASKQCTAAFKINAVKFKTTLINIDRLDTEKSRSKDTWTGNGHDCEDICNFIKYLETLSTNTVVEEFTAYVNFDFS
jgi:hypothetical protein